MSIDLPNILSFFSGVGWTIIALGILIFVHEMGHFLVAKKVGIRVERFSIGFGPKIIGISLGETEYCLSWIPLGGYVKVAGMADVGQEEATGEPWEYPSKSIPERMAVIAAGPAMNFLFAFFVLLAFYQIVGVATIPGSAIEPQPDSISANSGFQRGDRVLRIGEIKVSNQTDLNRALVAISNHGGSVEIDRDQRSLVLELPPADTRSYGLHPLLLTLVGSVQPGSPAQQIGLQTGDRILEVNGVDVEYWSDMSTQIRRYPDIPVKLVWQRDGEIITSNITPAKHNKDGQTFGQIGIGNYEIHTRVPFDEALAASALHVFNQSMLIVDLLGRIFDDENYKELGGLLTIGVVAAQEAEKGLEHYVLFLVMLSVNLAVLNLLPIAVLDGGHLTFLTLEAIMRRPLSLRQREITQQLGFVFIICLILFVFYNDITRIILPRL